MINWFFKYRIPGFGEKTPTPAKAAPPSPAVAAKAAGAKAKPEPPPRPAKDTEADWAPRLQAAMGDDAALLVVLGAAPVLAVKLAAVQALAGEAALKQAERAARQYDRRVHRLAKQRLEAAVAQRQSRTSAQALLGRAEALVGTAEVAVNELVELDRDWQALDASLLEPAQVEAFTTLRERLATQVRERGDLLQALKRWSAEAARTRDNLRTTLALAANEGNTDGLPALQAAAQALVDSRPDVDGTRADGVALQSLLDAALAVQARLAWLAEAEAVQPAEDGSTESPPAPGGWDALPLLADEALASALARRFDAWQRAWAERHAPPPAPPKAPRPARAARPALPGSEQQAELDALLQQAEAALADGQTGALQQRLQAIDQWLDDAGPLRWAEPSQARWTALQAEGARLKGWQAWGGALARDALVDEAEALARLAAAAMPAPVDDDQRSDGPMAAPAEAPAEAPVDAPMDAQPTATADAPMDVPVEGPMARTGEGAGSRRFDAVASSEPPTPRPPRLKLKAHADAIHSLRQRWKQLDRQGAAAKQATWARFDTALQAAYLPVAAQHAAQQATRERNLQTREALLVELEAMTLPGEGEGASAWKDRVRALDRFQLAWRPLGPLEHTVPAAARAPLQQRLRAAVERIEQPLAAAREAAAARRERLIADAQALVGDGSRPPGPQAPGRVRELQAAWQDEARALPLTRPVEAALWGRFKAATDAVFVLRDAGFAARDAEAAAALAAREALIERLSALPADAAPADAERLLAEVDRAWRQPADLPRGAAAALDARYADARSAVRRHAAERGRRRWHDECDALVARLDLCDERDDRAAADGEAATMADDLAARWAAAGEVPPSWRDALAQRWAGRPAAGPLPAGDVELHLLQLEAVFDMPASAEQQAARRELKLRALKDTLEGRARADDGPAAHRTWLLALLRQGRTNAGQRERLRRLLAALRGSDPGSLAGPPSRS